MKKAISVFLTVLIITMMISVSAFADFEKSVTVGTAVDEAVFTVNEGDSITDVAISSGSLPIGVNITYEKDGRNVKISGTCSTVGTYEVVLSVTYKASGDNTVKDVKVKLNVTEAITTAPVITKDPTGETVDEGGTAYFVARATGATKIEWKLVSPDASDTVPAEDFGYGLQVSGQGTETLVLSSIPARLDGWYVEARFYNDNGMSITSGAKVTVASVQPTPTPTPVPTPTPTPTPVPTETPAPTETVISGQNGTGTQANGTIGTSGDSSLTPAGESNADGSLPANQPSAIDNAGSSSGNILITIIVVFGAIALIAVIALVILKIKESKNYYNDNDDIT